MSDKIDDGGPAFPCMPPDDGEGRGCAAGYPYPDAGMSLRDWLAGKALTGICAHQDTWGLNVKEIAGTCYAISDAMLAARKARP